MPLLVRKFAELQQINTLLRGGIRGGRVIDKGIYGLDGATLVFSAPAATVTFATTPSGEQQALSRKQILDQINAVVGLVGWAKFADGKLVIEDPAGAVAVVLANTSTALAAFGFDKDGATGVVYAAPGGAAPALVGVSLETLSSSTYVVVTEEA